MTLVVKLVTSLFLSLASLGLGSNHSSPGALAMQSMQRSSPSLSAAATAAPPPAPHTDMTVKDLREVFQVHSHADGKRAALSSLPVARRRRRREPVCGVAAVAAAADR